MQNPLKVLKVRPRYLLENFRHSLAYIDALPQLTLLGAVVGLATGLLIIAFRLLMDGALNSFIPNNPENFEALPPFERSLLIAAGAAAVCLLMMVGRRYNQVGVGHALDRLHNHQGYLPWRNTVLQFFSALLCLISGQPVGREGPAVHLGAGSASFLGQWLKLPNNSLQTLIACGVAAAIAASFDTPMAGVIFAMEVVLMEYTVVGFVPVILSSVIGAAVSQAVFGQAGIIAVGTSSITGLLELPYITAGGLLIALAAAAFIQIHLVCLRTGGWPLPLRFALAAAFTIALAWYVPAIMGQGYDTLNAAMAGELALMTLIVIALAKLASSAAVTGLGVPGGIIGPTLVTGACIGGVLGLIAQEFDLGFASPDFYVTLGMAAMMAAVLNAPLAALVAVLELSYNPNIIFPAMLMIVAANVTTRSLFSLEGIFVEQLKQAGRPVRFRPAQQALRRAGVMSILDTHFTLAPRRLNYDEAKGLLASKPQWLVVETDKKKLLLQAVDLASYLDEAPVAVLSLEEEIDLLDIAARRRVLAPIHPSATLLEALQALRAEGTDALYVTRPSTPLISSIRGIVTQEAIENYYQP
jgi:CIC family chloride channel protein